VDGLGSSARDSKLCFLTSGGRLKCIDEEIYFNIILKNSILSLKLQGLRRESKVLLAYPPPLYSEFWLGLASLIYFDSEIEYFRGGEGHYDAAVGLPSLLKTVENVEAGLIFTDGEPLGKQRKELELKFNGSVRDAYGTTETGVIGIETEQNKYLLVKGFKIVNDTIITPWGMFHLPEQITVQKQYFTIEGMREEYVRIRGGGYINKKSITRLVPCRCRVSEGKRALIRVDVKYPCPLKDLELFHPTLSIISEEDGVPAIEVYANGVFMGYVEVEPFPLYREIMKRVERYIRKGQKKGLKFIKREARVVSAMLRREYEEGLLHVHQPLSISGRGV